MLSYAGKEKVGAVYAIAIGAVLFLELFQKKDGTKRTAQKEPVQMSQELINRHKPQLMLYKEALENGLNRKVDRVWIYSTGLGKGILVD